MPTWRELRRLHFEEATLRGKGEVPHLLTPAQRLFLASTKPSEELYDLQHDPHEILNLAADESYAGDLVRLRDALDQWQQTYGDLGLMPEAALIEHWRPGGIHRVTAPPEVRVVSGQISVTCPTEGASIAWTTDPPKPTTPPSPFAQAMSGIMGAPEPDGRVWHLYTGPLATEGHTFWFRACRLGYRDSEDVPFML
jgi:uncharacterized sulfatase